MSHRVGSLEARRAVCPWTVIAAISLVMGGCNGDGTAPPAASGAGGDGATGGGNGATGGGDGASGQGGMPGTASDGGGGVASGGSPGTDGSTAESSVATDAGDAPGGPKPPSFAPLTHWATGSGVPRQIAVGDVDRDGAPDVVVALDPFGVSVLRNTGSGQLAAPMAYASANANVNAIALGDLDGDGDVDVAVATHHVGVNAGRDVGVFLNDGAGVLGALSLYQATTPGQNPGAIVVGDVNHDGRPDLLVTSGISVSLLLNTGNGTFAPGEPWSITGRLIRSVATADLDGDGFVDLVAAQADAVTPAVGVGLNNGLGRLTAPAIVAVDSDAQAVTVADLNRDGWPDLAVATAAGVSVLLGRGDGTFAAAIAYTVDKIPWSVAVGDLNGDGWPDLIVGRGGATAKNVGVLTNRGDGTFIPVIDFPAGDTPWVVAIADLDRDGKPDIIVGSFATGVNVLINDTR